MAEEEEEEKKEEQDTASGSSDDDEADSEESSSDEDDLMINLDENATDYEPSQSKFQRSFHPPGLGGVSSDAGSSIPGLGGATTRVAIGGIPRSAIPGLAVSFAAAAQHQAAPRDPRKGDEQGVQPMSFRMEDAVFPSEWKPGLPLKLPGQTRVSPEEYISEGLFAAIGNNKPAFMHTLPIGQAITAETQIHPSEDVRKLMEEATVFVTRDCICRKEKEILEDKCEKPRHNCLTMSTSEHAFDVDYGGRIVTRAQAEKIIEDSEDAGLVHATMNLTGGTYHFCNCCPCCCGLLRGVTQLGAPGMLARSNYWAAIDEEECSSCGTCIDDRCPANAIDEHDDGYSVVNRDNCIGCGVCVSTCPTDAIVLVRKPEDQCVQAPADMVSWMMERSVDTGKPLDKLM